MIHRYAIKNPEPFRQIGIHLEVRKGDIAKYTIPVKDRFMVHDCPTMARLVEVPVTKSP